MRTFLTLSLFLFLPALLLADEEESLSVKAEVDKAFLTIGDRVEYRVTITHSPSIQILSKIVPPPSDAFEVKEAHDFSEKQGNQIAEGRRFVLTLYELGEFILDPVTVRYRTPQGEEKSMETNRLYLTVQSIDASVKLKTDIRGLKGVLALPGSWFWLLGIFLFLLCGGGGIFFWWRRWRQSREGEKAQEPILSPEDEALMRLNRLFDSDLLRRGKLKEYFLELSEILKNFFERRFEILAMESTSSEILRDLHQKELSQSLLEKTRHVMETADLVKFAKWKPPPAEIVRVNQMSKALVEEARPKIPNPEEAPSQTAHGI